MNRNAKSKRSMTGVRSRGRRDTGPRSVRGKNVYVLIVMSMIAALLLAIPTAATAVPPAPGDVFDDFEDNDASDWGFFGGNAAGGGGGPLSDRPAAGTYYFSTGWGGNGTVVFFGLPKPVRTPLIGPVSAY